MTCYMTIIDKVLINFAPVENLLVLVIILAFPHQVANPHVRANAATLLVDVFPLRDPEGAAADVDNLLQRQIDALQVRHHPV